MRPNHFPTGKIETTDKNADERLICCEVYNFNKQPIVFDLEIAAVEYIKSMGITVGPLRVEVGPDSFAFLTHRYYFSRFKNSMEPAHFLMNFGDNMGRGQKNQSAPEVFKRTF